MTGDINLFERPAEICYCVPNGASKCSPCRERSAINDRPTVWYVNVANDASIDLSSGSDLWGMDWTEAEVNAQTFQIRIPASGGLPEIEWVEYESIVDPSLPDDTVIILTGKETKIFRFE